MSVVRNTVDNVATRNTMPGPCALCGGHTGTRQRTGWVCAVCGWRYGDSPDPELPLPRVHVVYYLRFDDRVKIGTSADPRRRLARIRHQELLAFERGDRVIEHQRHREFAAAREGGEWFTLTDDIASHVSALRKLGDPWERYAEWFSQELRG